MKVLVVGGGGREHALAWKLARSPRVEKCYCAPGNPGTAALAKNVAIADDDVAGLRTFARDEGIDLTVVGPEGPLVAGIVDVFAAAGLRAWGPGAAAARLEGSKVAMKEFLQRYNIPTAPFRVFTDPSAAHSYVDEAGAPIVVKSDGLAAGKGVTVAADVDQAHAAIDRIMRERVFGDEAGRALIVEDILRGDEISVFAFCDGRNALILDTAQDHKAAYDGDEGPNTGGMGAFTPAPHLMRSRDWDDVVERILVPTLTGCRREERPYVGVLYMGLMLTDKGPQVVEYNVRFGDPECQPLMLRLEDDLVDVIEDSLDGRLDRRELHWSDDVAVCVTIAAPGYPGSYPKGIPIRGVDAAEALEGVTVFHAGTALKNGELVSAGGRVLSVCARGADLEQARSRAYAACDRIEMEGKHLRTDIGNRRSRRGVGARRHSA